MGRRSSCCQGPTTRCRRAWRSRRVSTPVFTTGFGFAAAALGAPDYGLMTMSEIMERTRHITRAVSIPLVADMDTGYGNELNVIRTIQECVEAGVAGVILEDQQWPKKCGHFDGKRVIPAEDHASKLKAAVHARGSDDLVIIARTDSRAPLGFDEAVRRGNLYRDAGADVVFVEAPQSMEELSGIVANVPDAPLFANMIEGGKTPFLSSAELQALGFKMVVYPPVRALHRRPVHRERLPRAERGENDGGAARGHGLLPRFREHRRRPPLQGNRAEVCRGQRQLTEAHVGPRYLT